MPAGTAPAAIAATSKMTHSGRLNPKMLTRSPGWTPSAMSDLAAARTSSAYVRHVVGRQFPPSLT